jgi:hypothetical protein
MALESNLNTALSRDYIRAFTAVQIALPAVGIAVAYNINLIDGSGTVTFPINGVPTTFTGSDPNFGSLDTLGTISESVATEAPNITLTLLSPTIGQISDPRYQGAPVRIWLGAVDDATGNVIGSPEELYSGWLDTAVTTHGMNVQKTVLNVASVWERLFIGSEGNRLTAAWHRGLFPGEGGLDNAVESKGRIPWGVAGAVASNVSYNASVRAILNKLAPNAISKD